jgi:hypothetical protein
MKRFAVVDALGHLMLMRPALMQLLPAMRHFAAGDAEERHFAWEDRRNGAEEGRVAPKVLAVPEPSQQQLIRPWLGGRICITRTGDICASLHLP